jgi:phospholipid/cholesterol/gamma-HCH transport system substrate-binding protein
MDLHYKREVTVGGLVILGLAVFVLGTTWLGGKSFKSEKLYQARFEKIGTLQEGSAVKISGYTVGRIRKVELKSMGNVVVSFSLIPTVTLKADARAVDEEPLAFGDAWMTLNPGSSETPLAADAQVPGTMPRDFVSQAQGLGDQADTVLIGVKALANQKTADELYATLRAMQRTLNILSERLPVTTDEATKTLASLRHMTGRLDTLLSNPALDRTVGRLDTLTTNLSGMTAQFTTTGARLDSLLAAILKGQGTLGKLASDSGLYNDTRATAQSLKALLDTLQKHPGKVTVQLKMF